MPRENDPGKAIDNLVVSIPEFPKNRSTGISLCGVGFDKIIIPGGSTQDGPGVFGSSGKVKPKGSIIIIKSIRIDLAFQPLLP